MVTKRAGLMAGLLIIALLAIPQLGNAGPTATPCQWEVEAGETLAGIGDQLGVDWRDLHEENLNVIGSNADLILVGDMIDSCVDDDPQIEATVRDVIATSPFVADIGPIPPPYPTMEKIPSTLSAYKQDPELEASVRGYLQWYAETEYGWTGDQWACLDGLYQRESSWYPKADNPNSSAATLWQVVKSTARHMGIPNHPDINGVWPEIPEQAKFGLLYIDLSYGDPCSALTFWLARVPINGVDYGNWYLSQEPIDFTPAPEVEESGLIGGTVR